MRGPARIATYLGRTLIVVGFLMIVFSWNGAASLDYIQGQFPYLLSGAIPGLAFVIVGAGLEYIQQQRQITARRAKQMASLNASFIRLLDVIREQDIAPVATAPARQRVPVGATAVGGAGQGTAAHTSSEYVVAGRSSYHAASCHLVAGRDGLPVMTRLEAQGDGLAACKICKP